MRRQRERVRASHEEAGGERDARDEGEFQASVTAFAGRILEA